MNGLNNRITNNKEYYTKYFDNSPYIPTTNIIKYMYDNYRTNISAKIDGLNIYYYFNFGNNRNKIITENEITYKNIKRNRSLPLDKLITFMFYALSNSFFYENNKKNSLLKLNELLKDQMRKDLFRNSVHINDIYITDLIPISTKIDSFYLMLIEQFQNKNIKIKFNNINKILLLCCQNIFNFFGLIFLDYVLTKFINNPDGNLIYITNNKKKIDIIIKDKILKINYTFKCDLLSLNTTEIIGSFEYIITVDILHNNYKLDLLKINIDKEFMIDMNSEINSKNINESNRLNLVNMVAPVGISSALISMPFMLALLGGKTKKQIVKKYKKKPRKTRKKYI